MFSGQHSDSCVQHSLLVGNLNARAGRAGPTARRAVRLALNRLLRRDELESIVFAAGFQKHAQRTHSF